MKLPTAIAAALLCCIGAAQAKGYHYSAPKAPKYHAPKLYAAPHVVPVRGYTSHDGTFVMPSHRTSPDSTRTDNWGSKPNSNPYTGKPGTKDPYTPTCCGK